MQQKFSTQVPATRYSNAIPKICEYWGNFSTISTKIMINLKDYWDTILNFRSRFAINKKLNMTMRKLIEKVKFLATVAIVFITILIRNEISRGDKVIFCKSKWNLNKIKKIHDFPVFPLNSK